MVNPIQVIANTGDASTFQTMELVPGHGDQGKSTRIKAFPKGRYLLQDPALNNQGPQKVRTQRVGKNLHVMLDGSVQPDLIVEGYFDEANLIDANQGLMGRNANGAMRAYVPSESTAVGLGVEGGAPVTQLLSAAPLAAGAWPAMTAGAGLGAGIGMGAILGAAVATVLAERHLFKPTNPASGINTEQRNTALQAAEAADQAATDASTAALTAASAKADLAAAVAALSSPATPAQLAAVEAKQAAAQAAAAVARDKAAAALVAAQLAHTTAAALNAPDPASVAAANTAAAAANTAAQAANEAATRRKSHKRKRVQREGVLIAKEG